MCGGDIHVWEVIHDVERHFTCGGDIHVWRRHSPVGAIHVLERHSRVEGTFTAVESDIHNVEGTFTCGSYSDVGAIHVWMRHSRMETDIHVMEEALHVVERHSRVERTFHVRGLRHCYVMGELFMCGEANHSHAGGDIQHVGAIHV